MKRVSSVLIAIVCLMAATVGLPTTRADAAGHSGCDSRSPDGRALTAVLSRTIGHAARQVCFDVKQSAGPEKFTISGSPGHIRINASTRSAATTGAGWYLKYVVHADVNLGNFTPNVPRVLPAPKAPISHSSSVQHRYEGNDTQDGYTNPYMSWSKWQQMLDMYALHGINEVYVLPGSDAVHKEMLQDFGYTAAQAKAWVPLPATQPWWVMQNLSNDTAPISQALLDDRAALGRKIIQRCKELGITPVLPGYFGTVPTDFAEVNSTASNGNPPHVVQQGTWNLTQRPAWLDPTDPLFPKVAASYYKHADKLLGKSAMYRMNPLQEGGKLGGIDPGKAANAIMTALQKAEPGATWMQLGWQKNPTKEQLDGLTTEQKSHLLISDGITDTRSSMPERDTDWPDTPWMFGTIPFGGGQTAMGANGQVWIDRYYKQVAKSGSNMTGISFAPEGLNDPAAFELFAELPWHSKAFDLDTWFSKYAEGRYGTTDAAAAWSAISTTYKRPITCCKKESPLGKTPSLNAAISVGYDTETFATALPLLTGAAKSVTQPAAYNYDLADVSNQVITNWANSQLPKISTAYDDKDLAAFNGLTKTWLAAMQLDDKVLGTVPYFTIGTYVADAEKAGHSKAESAAYRTNLLDLWSIWFSNRGPSAGNDDLLNYAAHLTSGMIEDYYQPGWQKYFDSLRTAMETGSAPEKIDWLAFGDKFASSSKHYPTVPRGNTVSYARKITKLLGVKPVAEPKITTPVNGSSLPESPTSVAGTGVAGAQVAVTDAGSPVCTATVAADESWSCAPSEALTDGPHTLSAVQTDAEGRTSNPATVTVSVGADPTLADNWTFDSAVDGVVADNGKDQFDGTMTGSTTLATGKAGKAAKFDGTVAPVNTSAPNLSGPWAVGVWVNPSVTSHSANLINGERVQGNSSLKIQQNVTSGAVGATAFYVKDYATDYVAPLKSWTYLTYVCDGRQITVYANGKSVGTIPAAFPLSRAAIGSTQSNAGKDVYTGLIDELSIFGNSLTPEQVAALYASAQTGGTQTH
ncbi:alpha-N-acetylglucosaminidase TIM-barrel domain-containing protein [Flexivirga sp. B27]